MDDSLFSGTRKLSESNEPPTLGETHKVQLDLEYTKNQDTDRVHNWKQTDRLTERMSHTHGMRMTRSTIKSTIMGCFPSKSKHSSYSSYYFF